MPSLTTSGGATTAPEITAPIVSEQIESLISRWAEAKQHDLAASSLRVYTDTIGRMAKQMKWQTTHDISPQAVSDYMTAKVAAGEWSKSTYNKTLIILSSWVSWLAQQGVLVENPIAGVRRKKIKDRGHRGRAFTVTEARQLLSWTEARERTDGRASGYRGLTRACMLMQGMRPGEPEILRWKHVKLDTDVPFIRWTPDIQKNGRTELTALNPELAQLLRNHRDNLIERKVREVVSIDRRNNRRTVRPCDPGDPEAFVVPQMSPRSQFRTDLEAAGIALVDEYDRSMEMRSCRRYFATTLRKSGVADSMVNRLMRHVETVPELYYDADLAEQAEAVAKLPRIWPGNYEKPDDSTSPSEEGGQKIKKESLDSLTIAAGVGKLCHPEPRPGNGGVEYAGLNPDLGISGLNLSDSTPSTREVLADFLEATARLLRGAVRDDRTIKPQCS